MKTNKNEIHKSVKTENNGKQQSLISIIVPVYNAEEYLENCVDCILRQTYTNFELILVDDGSQDDSLLLCRRLSKQDSRIKVYTQANRGASSARNKGLQVAEGSYLVFVDSDDYISDTYLENLYLAARIGPYDIVQCNLKRTSTQVVQIPFVRYNENDVQEITKEQALNGRVYKSSVCGKIYAVSILEDFRFQEGIIYEDDASYYRFVDRASKIAVLNETLYYYYLSDNSVMRNSTRDKSTVFIDIYKERIQYFRERNNCVLLEGTYSRFCLVLMLRISRGMISGRNKADIGRFMDLFKQYYPKIKASKHVGRKDKFMLACFNFSPPIVGRAIGLIRMLRK